MSLFKTKSRPPVTAVSPVDVAAVGAAMAEQQARNSDAAHLIERALYAQTRLWPDDRNDQLIDVLLELRSTLRPPVTEEAS